MMNALFSRVLEMSLTGTGTIMTVLLLRLLLRNQRKGITCLLWAAVVIRLLCPVVIECDLPLASGLYDAESAVSRLRDTVVEDTVVLYSHTDAYAQAVEQGREPQIHKASGARYLLAAEDDGLAPDTAGEVWFPALGWIWLIGAGLLACETLAQYICLKRKLRDSLRSGEGYCVSDHIGIPFVLGFFRPEIYLPSGLTESQRHLVLTHERCHIRSLDHWTKLVLLAMRCVHWFNPAVWIACSLAVRDLEMRCDEAVIRRLGPEVRTGYAQTILNFSSGRAGRSGLMTGFGGGEIRGRILRVIRWKKPPVWRSCICLVLCLGAVAMMVADSGAPAPLRWIESLDPEQTRVKAYPAYEVLPDPTLQLTEKQTAHLTELLQNVEEDQVRLDPGEPLIPVGSLHLQTGDQVYYLFLDAHRHKGTIHVRMGRHGDPEHAYFLENLALTEYVEHVFDHFVCSPLSPKQLSEELVQVDSFYLDSRTHVYVFQYYCDRCGTYSKKYVESEITASRLHRWKE